MPNLAAADFKLNFLWKIFIQWGSNGVYTYCDCEVSSEQNAGKIIICWDVKSTFSSATQRYSCEVREGEFSENLTILALYYSTHRSQIVYI